METLSLSEAKMKLSELIAKVQSTDAEIGQKGHLWMETKLYTSEELFE